MVIKTFFKIKFLNLIHKFYYKTFKKFIIYFIKKKTYIILYNYVLRINKICKKLLSTYSIIFFLLDYILFNKILINIKNIYKSIFN